MKAKFLSTLIFLFAVPTLSYASVSVGTIDPANHLTRVCQDATCSSFGTVNWAPTINGNTPGATPVVITDTGLSGYLWGDEIGWVNMSPTGSGVTINPNTGALSGYAFANTGGWVNFRPTQSAGNPTVGVSIDNSGQFTGYAYVSGIKGGWMKFDCTVPATCITTDWRPIPARVAPPPPPPAASGGSSGGGGTALYPLAPTANPSPSTPATSSTITTTTETTTSTGKAVALTDVNTEDQNIPEEEPERIAPLPTEIQPSPPAPSEGISVGEAPLTLGEVPPPLASTDPFLPLGLLGTLASIMLLLMSPLGELVKAGSLRDAQLVIARTLGILTLRRTRLDEPWGTVYDSLTKQPLDPAYVSLISKETGKEYKSAITDLDGRYGFLVAPGIYTMLASKTHYVFPSSRLLSKKSDPIYDALYFGEDIVVSGEHEVVKRNIPLDPVGVDWNEAEKKRMGIGSSARKRRQRIVMFMNALFFVGFFYSCYAYIVDPVTVNMLIVLFYIAYYILEKLWRRHFHLSRTTKETGKGLPFAVIKLFFPDNAMLVKKVVADEDGRFYMLATPGVYEVRVDERVGEDVYAPAPVRQVQVKMPKGILLEDVVVGAS